MKKLNITKFEPMDFATNEALNTLCTNISFLGSEMKKIMVTANQTSKGKSSLVMNMLRTFSALGKSIVYVSADLRSSVLKETYNMAFDGDNSVGLTDYLSSLTNMQDVIYETNLPGAFMVPAGRVVSNPMTLLSSQRFPALLDFLAANYDIVLVDSPPLGIIIDAAEIAKSCDGAVLVVDFHKVRRRELNDIKSQIELTGCRVLGTVLINVPFGTYENRRYYRKGSYSQFYNMKKLQ